MPQLQAKYKAKANSWLAYVIKRLETSTLDCVLTKPTYNHNAIIPANYSTVGQDYAVSIKNNNNNNQKHNAAKSNI